MGRRVHIKPKRIALPKDAVYIVHKKSGESNSQDANPSQDGDISPIRYWDCFEDWLRGTPIENIATDLNVTMREMDGILRQLVVEKLANTKKNKRAQQKH